MDIIRLVIKPLTGFGSLPVGETFFGQSCWTIRNLFGEERLQDLLKGYCQGEPFLVVSDAFPSGYIPLPLMPSFFWETRSEDLKVLKKKRWFPRNKLSEPLTGWQKLACSDSEVYGGNLFSQEFLQTHNSIDRTTGTTGNAVFAPFVQSVQFITGEYDLYLGFDSNRISQEELEEVFRVIGISGFGRDASVGLGKFEIQDSESVQFEQSKNSVMTLSGCCISGLELGSPTFYKPDTYFGRHGSLYANGVNPFKKPIIKVQTAAVLTPSQPLEQPFIGMGLTNISSAYPETVHQGYALTIGLGYIEGSI